MTQASVVSKIAPRMLIADDDPAVVRLLADRFAQAGFEIDTATNGVQALIKAKRNHPDILVIDFNMPGANGLSVCSRLLDPSRKPLNVVLITASQERETLERCEGFGVSYVRKGATFWSDLTLALSQAFPLMADNLKELGVPPRGAVTRGHPRVLVIDDDPASELFLRSRLNKYSVDSIFAGSAPLGVRIACREQPSVIISDYSMPDGDIYYLLAKLRTTPATEAIPVFVWTGSSLTEVDRQNLRREVCGHPGVTQIFTKSFDIDELFIALQQHIAFEAATSAFKSG